MCVAGSWMGTVVDKKIASRLDFVGGICGTCITRSDGDGGIMGG